MFTSVSVAIEIYFLTDIHLGGNINGVAILIPSGDGRNDAGHCDILSLYSLKEIFLLKAIQLHYFSNNDSKRMVKHIFLQKIAVICTS